MSVVGISVIRDEAEIVASTVGHMLTQCDRVIVADNGSVDGTRDILVELGAEVRDDPEPGHYQSRKMSALANEARAGGATWIVPFDADEIWTGKRGTVRRTLEGLPDWIMIAEAALYDHVATGRDNGTDNPIRRLRWRRRHPLPLPKIAVRAMPGVIIHDGNHGVTIPGHDVPPIIKHLLTVRHFPYRSAEHMIRKARRGAAALNATDLAEHIGQHWRDYDRMTDEQITETFYRHFYREDPTVEIVIDGEHQPPLVEDPVRIGG